VSRVLLVGGSSRIPLVAELVGAELGRPVATDAHPKHAIALGAAIAAAASVAGESTVALADATSVVATAEAKASRVTDEVAPVAGVAAWHHDPTGRHEHRYWDGATWTTDVSDGGVASVDPLGSPGAAFAPAGASTTAVTTETNAPPSWSAPSTPPPGGGPVPTPPSSTRGKSRTPLIVGAVIAVVAVIAIIALVAGGGGGGSGDNAAAKGTGSVKGDIPAGGVFIHHVKVPSDSVLLIKAIPQGQFKLVVSVATDFDTLDKYKTVFGNTNFGTPVKTESNSTYSDVDVSTVPGAIFVNAAAFGDGDSVQLGVPVPFGADLDIAVTAQEGKSGAVTLQTEVKKFNGPGTDDGGIFYIQLMEKAYQAFLQGDQQIDRQRDFTAQSDFTTNPDFAPFTDQFASDSDFSDVPAS
jgi:hypothetical protein